VPKLTEFLERSRVLLVLDNLESLLTDAGDWRDERWGVLINALTGHGGLGRVVLTSRRRPRTLDARVRVEAVHALSRDEAVLLARELPNLRRLLDGQAPGVDLGTGRELVARTLAVVQGHPKLLELADGQAGDPTQLQQRLAEANRSWAQGGIPLTSFLERGEASASAEDYLRVLDGWTRSTALALPDDARLLFQVLCCLEEPDRLSLVLKATWAGIWRRLEHPGDPPDPAQELRVLVERGLVAVEAGSEDQPAAYHLHPGVAMAGRGAAGDRIQAAVDTELAAYWYAGLQADREEAGGELGGLVVRAGLAVAPYLLRRQGWATASHLLEEALLRDESVGTAAAMLPLLRRIAAATRGTDRELVDRGMLGRVLRVAGRPDEAEAEQRAVLAAAQARGQFDLASGIARELLNLLRDTGRLQEALALADQTKALTRQAGPDPWTQLADEAMRLQLLRRVGRSAEVVERVEQLRAEMATLPPTRAASRVDERIKPWQVRELLLQTGALAAIDLKDWAKALAFNAEVVESRQRRDAPLLDQARARFNDYGPLLRSGRVQEARQLLRALREVFARERDLAALGKATGALADVEDELGHRDTAIALAQDALRLSYAAGDPGAVALSHHIIADYLGRAGRDPSEALAHRLAAAVLHLSTGQKGELARTLRALARDLQQDALAAPESFAQLRAQVERVDGVPFGELVARLPAGPGGPDAALAEVLHRARALLADQASNIPRHLQAWGPVIGAIAAASDGDQTAAAWVRQHLAERAQEPGWAALAERLGRVLAGECDPDQLLGGLGPTDAAIVQRTLEVLAGRAQLPPDQTEAWQAWALLDTWQPVIDLVVAAARGDPQAASQADPVLTDLEQQADWAELTRVLRQITAGDRDPELLDGLDHTDTLIATAVLEALGGADR
jgi:tetratricopeptide (TPR) repeat protein